MKARTILFYTMSSLLAVMVAAILGIALYVLYFLPQEPYLEYLELQGGTSPGVTIEASGFVVAYPDGVTITTEGYVIGALGIEGQDYVYHEDGTISTHLR